MNENKIIIKSDAGKEISYDILFLVKENNYNYIVYTKNKENKDKNITCYFTKYVNDTNKLLNVTKKESIMLENLLNKFRSKDEK